jgi:hypothetical protein
MDNKSALPFRRRGRATVPKPTNNNLMTHYFIPTARQLACYVPGSINRAESRPPGPKFTIRNLWKQTDDRSEAAPGVIFTL